ncbi:MAG: type II secretion system F family protein [Nanoarchaeota archaeon]|nr:type II secretion system F family protein [Nanoarchaeota archaeon]
MIIIINIGKIYLSRFPEIRQKLKIAHTPGKPEEFVNRSAKAALTLASVLTLTFFFMLSAFEANIAFAILAFPVLLGGFFYFMMHTPDVQIKRRRKEIDREVLFAGRFILVKLESGIPFFNALSDAAQAHGAAGKYFQEIVDDINLGTPIEEALENSIELSPSDKFRRILYQITNSLKTGIDVTDTLRGILQQIATEQVIEIKEYGKKLNSMAMFYMLIGIVVPALGMTLFIIIASFLSLAISFRYLLAAAGALAFMQFMFITLFKSIRPTVEV